MKLQQTHYVSFDGSCYWLIPMHRQDEWNEFLLIPQNEDYLETSDEFWEPPEWAKPLDRWEVDAMELNVPMRMAA